MADQRVPMTFRDLFSDDPFFKSTWDDFERAREKMMKESREMWKKFEEEDGEFTRETMRPMTSPSSEKGSKSSRMESSSRTYESRSSSNMGSSSSKQEERSSSGRSSRNNNEGSSRTRQEEMSNSGRSSRNENDGLSRKYDERSGKRSEKGSSNEISGHDWMVPPSWMFPKPEGLRMNINDADNEVINIKENDDKFEVSLNTSKYKPSELQVNVGGGVISVEGKHEEKAEDGTVMVSRQFSRQYSLPERAKPTNVVSNLSSDGILVVTAPKDKPAITQGQRSVPIAV